MCERVEVLGKLRALEASGVPHVNTPQAVLNTYRERMLEAFAEANVPFVESRVVSTRDRRVEGARPVWVKRADVHNTRGGDVVFASTADAVHQALEGLAARGIPRAVLQPHVDGDLVKFYGVGAGEPHGAPPWFCWFYHKGQRLAGHPFDERRHVAPGSQSFALMAGLAMARGTGSTLIDEDGNEYIDFIAGIAVGSVGHCHPHYVEALKRQVERLTFGSFTTETRAKFLELLASVTPAGLTRIQMFSGGAEAVEAALRLA